MFGWTNNISYEFMKVKVTKIVVSVLLHWNTKSHGIPNNVWNPLELGEEQQLNVAGTWQVAGGPLKGCADM